MKEKIPSAECYGRPVPNVDAFIDAAGAQPLFLQAFQLAKPNSRFAIIAVYKQPVPVSFADIMSREVKIIGASGYSHENITKVVDHIEKKKTPIASIVTHRYSLDELPQAFETAIAAKETLKVVVDLTN